MKWPIIAGIVLTVAILGAFGVFYFMQLQTDARNANSQSLASNPFGESSSAVTTVNSGTSQNTVGGGDATANISINEATKKVIAYLKSTKTPLSSGVGNYYELGVPVQASSTPAYQIFFVEENQGIWVTIHEEPIGKVRRTAEQALLTELGITQQEACTLEHAVIVMAGVSAQYEDQNLGFSFCPGSVVLSEI